MQNESNQTVPTNSSYSQVSIASLSTIDIVYIVMGVAVIAINATVIYLFATRKYLQASLSNIFLFNLALSDLCYGLVSLPLSTVCSKLINEICYAYYFFMIFSSYLSVSSILLGIIEKFFAICFTMKHHVLFTRSLAIKLCLSVWIMSAVIAHIPQWWYSILKHPDQANMDVKFNICLFILVFVIPVIASAIMYTVMLRRISKQYKTMASVQRISSIQPSCRLKNERKTALIFGLVFTVSLVCWTGWFVLTKFTKQIMGELNSTKQKILIRFVIVMRILAAILNPLLYTFIKNDFRKALKSLGKTTSEIDRKINTTKAFIEKEKTANSNQRETTL